MKRLPRIFRQHVATIEPYLGTDGNNRKLYGPPVAAEGWVEEGAVLVKDKDGQEVTSQSRFKCDLDTTAPAESRVTLPSGQVTEVIRSDRRDGGKWAVPSHLEIACE